MGRVPDRTGEGNFGGLIPFANENRWIKRQPLTRPSATLSPSDGERDGVRGVRVIQPILFGKWYHLASSGQWF